MEVRVPEILAPAVAFVGAIDPDFPDPAAEAEWLRGAIDADVTLIPDVAHYPQNQAPEVVVPLTLAFLADLPRDAAGRFQVRTSARA